MAKVDRDKFRSVGFIGKTKGKVRVREEGRSTHVDYKDGRTEVVVRPEAIRGKLSLSDG